MPLILAIEPDRRQASQLTAMVRGRLHADFVIADSAEKALASLGDRIPDLVLTTALLSPKDESALADRLRALDGAAAHVQTLTIPVLATPGRSGRRAAKAGGVLLGLLRDKDDADASAEGCDPAFFADQCREYLVRAAHERAAMNDLAGVAPDAPTVTVETVAVEAAADDVADAAETEETEDLQPTADDSAESASAAFFAEFDEDEPPASLMAAVAALTDLEERASGEPSQGSIEAADYTQAAADDQELATHYDFLDVDLSQMLDDPARRAAAQRADELEEEDKNEFASAVYELDSSVLDHDESPEAAYVPLERPAPRSWPILEGLTTGSQDLEAPISALVADETPTATAAPNQAADEDQWADIIEALRRDAEPIPIAAMNAADAATAATDPTSAQAEPEPVSDAHAAHEPTPPDATNRRRTSPIQDEWGFFDPDQAGFAALLAKLEEETDVDESPAAPPRL